MNYDFNIVLIGAGDSSIEFADYLLNDKNLIQNYFQFFMTTTSKNKKFFKS